MTAKLALPAGDIVGESRLWADRRDRLIWVDIIGRRIHALRLATGVHHETVSYAKVERDETVQLPGVH